jgi:hypothetical protein
MTGAGRELHPREVVADLLEELLVQNPGELADQIIEWLRDAGFAIVDWREGQTSNE